VDTTDTAADSLGGRRILRIDGLNHSTTYYAKRRCGSGVDVFSFATLADEAARSIQVNGGSIPAATAAIESGMSPESLTAGAAVACATGCALTIPQEHRFYRVTYQNSNGTTIARGDMVAVP
jgi:hypothetical protein